MVAVDLQWGQVIVVPSLLGGESTRCTPECQGGASSDRTDNAPSRVDLHTDWVDPHHVRSSRHGGVPQGAPGAGACWLCRCTHGPTGCAVVRTGRRWPARMAGMIAEVFQDDSPRARLGIGLALAGHDGCPSLAGRDVGGDRRTYADGGQAMSRWGAHDHGCSIDQEGLVTFTVSAASEGGRAGRSEQFEAM